MINKNILRKIAQNKIFIYIVSRYGIMGLGFFTSLIIAGKLGPYYFGMYGFILLLLSYFAQLHLGIPNSLNVLLVHNKSNIQKSSAYIINSLFLYVYFAMAIVIVYILYMIFGFSSIKKYDIDPYLPFVCIIAVLEYINGVFLCVLRIKNRINLMSFITSIKTVLNLIVVFLFDGVLLINALVICLVISNVLSITICYWRKIIPQFRGVIVKRNIQAEILNKGILLFFYNTCFYFIVISIRSIISSNYSVEDFGSFTFSYTIVTAVIMLLEAVYTIMFPKIVDLLSSLDYKRIDHTLKIVRISYVSTSHMLIYMAMIFYPIITNIVMPNYSNSLLSLNLVSLSLLMNANSTGYSTLIIAQNKEKFSAIISITALILNIILANILVRIFNVEYSYVIIATMVTYIYFSFMVVYVGQKIIKSFCWRIMLSHFFPVRLLLPFVSAVVVSLLQINYLLWIPFVLYAIFNVNDIKNILAYAKVIINNENISDINN